MRYAIRGKESYCLLLIGAMVVSACTRPLPLPPASRHQGDRPSTTQYGKPRPDTTTPPPRIAEIRVRYWARSADVGIVAWDPADDGYGLSASLRPNGTLINDHRVYVSADYEVGISSYPYAMLGSRNLRTLGITRDEYNCWFGEPCSPRFFYAARVPDDLLRAHRDSLAVRFYNYDRTITLSFAKDFVRAYLAAVDSMAGLLQAAQKKN